MWSGCWHFVPSESSGAIVGRGSPEPAAGTIACSPLARSGHQMRGQESQQADAGAMALHHRRRPQLIPMHLSSRLVVAVPDLHLAFIVGTQQILAACL